MIRPLTPANPLCPHCQDSHTHIFGKAKSGLMTYKCPSCGKKHTPGSKRGRPKREDGLTPMQAWRAKNPQPFGWKDRPGKIHLYTENGVLLCGNPVNFTVVSKDLTEVNCGGCRRSKLFPYA
jgi:hypothetical protein